jgi:hypothetical protein
VAAGSVLSTQDPALRTALRKRKGKRSVFLLELAPRDLAGLEVARRLAGVEEDLEYWRAKAIVSADRTFELPLETVHPKDAPERTRLTLTDRYGEIVAEYESDFPSAADLVEWAKFLEISCGACSGPS